MADELDPEVLERFLADHFAPGWMTPEELLTTVIEDAEEDAELAELAEEASGILSRWKEQGDTISPVQKRFEAEAFFTKHKFLGSDGFPLPTGAPKHAAN